MRWSAGCLCALLLISFSCGGSSGKKKNQVAPLLITTTTLPDGSVGIPYAETLQATGGIPSYTWSLASGALPPGLILDAAGNITGTPTAPGTSPFTGQVTDSNPSPETTTAALSITIADTLTVTTTTLPDGTVGIAYAATLQAVGGIPPYNWSISSGKLPPGITLDAAGDFSGIPTTPGIYSIVVEAADSQVVPARGSAPLDLLVYSGVGGNPPYVGQGLLPGTYRKLVDIPYKITDADNDPLTITAEYSTDDGITFQPATSGPGGHGFGPFQGSSLTVLQLFQWDSETDVGPTQQSLVRIRLTAYDTLASAPDLTSTFIVDNRPGRSIFTPGPRLNEDRKHHATTLLPDGTVLVTGGEGSTAIRHRTAEIYSTQTGVWTLLPNPMTSERSGHTSTLLSDGTVLIAGGLDMTGNGLSTAEIYDPVTQQFTATGVMSERRQWHAAAGPLVTGGYDSLGPSQTYFDEVQDYDPVAGTFGSPDLITLERARHTATALPGGHVLLVGGSDQQGLTAEEFDPATGTSPVTHTLGGLTETMDHAAALLQGGQALLTGGGAGRGIVSIANSLDVAYIYDSTTGFASVGPMTTTRRYHTASTLQDGSVMMAGGLDDPSITPKPDAEIYDTSSGFAVTGPMAEARMHHTAVVLADGRVLVIGGTANGTDPLRTSEMFNP